jgi:hypothetical protein
MRTPFYSVCSPLPPDPIQISAGRDDDDPYAGGEYDEEEEAAHWNADGSWAGPRNATATVRSMKSRVSSLHKRIDELVALLQYADVRFKRHLQTAESTARRVVRGTLIETAVIIGVGILQVAIIRRFDFKVKAPHAWV